MEIPNYSTYSDDQLRDCLKVVDRKNLSSYKILLTELKRREILETMRARKKNSPSLPNPNIIGLNFLRMNLYGFVLYIILLSLSAILNISIIGIIIGIVYFFVFIFGAIIYPQFLIYREFQYRFLFSSLYTGIVFSYYPMHKINFKNYILELEPDEENKIKILLRKGAIRFPIQFFISVVVMILSNYLIELFFI